MAAGHTARLVCGYLACDARPFNPLLEALPPMLKAGDADGNDTGWLGQFIHFAVAEVAEKRAGSESVLTKLSELMFIDVVRRYIESLPAQNTGWLAGLRDPLVGKALALIHARPSFNWTVEGLARQCGAFAHGAGRALRQARRHAADALSRQMADAGCLGTAEAATPTWRPSPPRSATIRSGLQPRLQEDDRRAAFGMAARACVCATPSAR